jgi:hypothetical protein
MTLSTRFRTTVNLTLVGAANSLGGAAEYRREYAEALTTLANGVGAGQADRLYVARRTIAASANEDLDLAGGLTDPLGAALTFAKLKGLLIKAAEGNTNNVRVTRPATNGVPIYLAAGDGEDVQPDGTLLKLWPGAGIVVTAATGDLINIANSGAGTGVTYDVILVGTSA